MGTCDRSLSDVRGLQCRAMTIDPLSELRHATAGGLEFAYFEQGEGPLALCLTATPTPHTPGGTPPALAAAGYRAVAPFNRGYAPTSFAADGRYHAGVARESTPTPCTRRSAATATPSSSATTGVPSVPTRPPASRPNGGGGWPWRCPPGRSTAQGFLSYEQLKLSWYIFFQLNPLAEMVIPMNDYEYITKLWRDWSPGYDEADRRRPLHRGDGHARAPHRGVELLPPHGSSSRSTGPRLADAAGHGLPVPPQPLLYLHGRNDGCMARRSRRRPPSVLTAREPGRDDRGRRPLPPPRAARRRQPPHPGFPGRVEVHRVGPTQVQSPVDPFDEPVGDEAVDDERARSSSSGPHHRPSRVAESAPAPAPSRASRRPRP